MSTKVTGQLFIDDTHLGTVTNFNLNIKEPKKMSTKKELKRIIQRQEASLHFRGVRIDSLNDLLENNKKAYDDIKDSYQKALIFIGSLTSKSEIK